MFALQGKSTKSCLTSAGPTWCETMDRHAANRWPSLPEIRTIRLAAINGDIFIRLLSFLPAAIETTSLVNKPLRNTGYSPASSAQSYCTALPVSGGVDPQYFGGATRF